MAIGIYTQPGTSMLLQSSLQKRNQVNEALASGQRINRAADDVAGLQQSERLGALINQSQQQRANIGHEVGAANIQAAEVNHAGQTAQALQGLLTAAGNGLNTAQDQQALQQQIGELVSSVPNAAALGLDTIDVVSGDPQTNQDTLTAALKSLGAEQAGLGAQVNRLESAANTAAMSLEQQSASRARILDTDIAAASTEQVKRAVLLEAALQTERAKQDEPRRLLDQFV